jgi:hypothetical protein
MYVLNLIGQPDRFGKFHRIFPITGCEWIAPAHPDQRKQDDNRNAPQAKHRNAPKNTGVFLL